MSIHRVKIELQGGPGGNGVVTLFALDGATAQPAVKAVAQNWAAGTLPNDVVLNVPNQGDILNEETGEVTGVWLGGTVGGFTGVDTAGWAAGSGMRVQWKTAGIVAGRHVRGRSFFVPMGAGIWENNGLPKATIVDAVGSWCSTMLGVVPGNFVIWSRPKGDQFGSAHPITSVNVPVSAASLRSRRT